MVAGNPAFTLEELHSFTVDQLHRICGYLDVKYKKKDTKDGLVAKIWEEIKPIPPTHEHPVAEIDGQAVPVTAQLKRIQEFLEGEKLQ